MLAAAFGNKLCWFESHYWHISLFSPDNLTCASSSLSDENAERVALTSADIQRIKAPSVYECFVKGFDLHSPQG